MALIGMSVVTWQCTASRLRFTALGSLLVVVQLQLQFTSVSVLELQSSKGVTQPAAARHTNHVGAASGPGKSSFQAHAGGAATRPMHVRAVFRPMQVKHL